MTLFVWKWPQLNVHKNKKNNFRIQNHRLPSSCALLLSFQCLPSKFWPDCLCCRRWESGEIRWIMATIVNMYVFLHIFYYLPSEFRPDLLCCMHKLRICNYETLLPGVSYKVQYTRWLIHLRDCRRWFWLFVICQSAANFSSIVSKTDMKNTWIEWFMFSNSRFDWSPEGNWN